MRRRWTTLVTLAMVAALALALARAVSFYGARVDPERRDSTPRDLNRQADTHLDQALAILNDVARPPAERIAGYRAELERAEALLTKSLRAQPAQALILARLAAVRFELDPPATPEAAERYACLVRTAAEMAPNVPRVQLRLGELLIRMGRQDEGLRYLGRAVELEPDIAAEAVKPAVGALMGADTIRRALPALPQVAVALEGAYLAEDGAAAYLDALDDLLGSPTQRLVASYGFVALRAGQPERLLEAMGSLGEQSDAEIEAERLLQQARAKLALVRPDEALEDARAARARAPDSPRVAEMFGLIAMGAGRPDDAIRAFREAIGLIVRDSGNARNRARLYRLIGQAEESAGRPDRAYDAYKQAVALDADETIARKRLSEMHDAAGVGGGPK